MTYHGPFATVDDDERFNGDFDEYENEVYIETYPQQAETRRSLNVRVEWCEPHGEGHALCVVVRENGVGQFDALEGIHAGDRLVVTTDGFEPDVRTRYPLTRNGETTAVGRDTRVYTPREWGEYMTGMAESQHEAELDRRREQHFEQRTRR